MPAVGSSTGGPTPGTSYRLQNVTSGLLLDSGGSTTGGSPVNQWTWDPSPNLQWRFVVDVGGGYHQIINHANGMAVDGGGATTSGAAAKQ
ncbi:RICIN domain-containing protein [Paractinoplanes rishiriensis]|uniref:RICIN domain-containing protein n=1 Tax=Paractinoplanes rishiriensis TaxID=1050105 RepID=UPI0034DB29DA